MNATMRAAQEHYDNMAPPDAPSYEAQDLILSIGWMEEAIGRAERAIRDGNLAAAVDLLREAGNALVEEMDGMSS